MISLKTPPLHAATNKALPFQYMCVVHCAKLQFTFYRKLCFRTNPVSILHSLPELKPIIISIFLPVFTPFLYTEGIFSLVWLSRIGKKQENILRGHHEAYLHKWEQKQMSIKLSSRGIKVYKFWMSASSKERI